MSLLRKALPLVFLALSLAASSAAAQTTEALRQTFNAPKADVEQALKDLNAYQSGRLPFLEGFVGSIYQPLNGFQRPTYQYSIVVQQASDSDVIVSVDAKISAWYEDKDASKSGYRDLPSNGRLETDLLDRLRGRLRQTAEQAAAARVPLVSPKLLGTSPIPIEKTNLQPEAPSANAAPQPNFRDYARAPMPPGATATPELNAREARLVQEEKALNEVLAAQQHPDNLVAVKAPHAAIVSAPAAGSRVLMYAEAEDEFQFLKSEGEWTHLQIAGLNRGWIRSAQVEKIASSKPPEPVASTEAFHQSKEETSTFPGDWAPLRGKKVKVIWVQPNGKSTQKSRLNYAESVFKKQVPQITDGVEGVVIIFDAAEGGMAAATVASLQQWGAGSLSDGSFLKQCWFDPAEAFAMAHP